MTTPCPRVSPALLRDRVLALPDVIYLITPDRFANGEQGNNRVERIKQGVDRSDPDGRHGGDLEGARLCPFLKALTQRSAGE